MEGVTSLAQSPTGMTDGELYEYDFPAWCELQAGRLRVAGSAATGHDQPDWAHLIEEIQDMGAAQRRQVESLLVQAIVHLMKLQMVPHGPDAPHWMAEIRAFLGDARQAFAPSMRRVLDLDDIYNTAAFILTGRRIAAACPFTLDELIGPFPDVVALVAKLPAPPSV